MPLVRFKIRNELSLGGLELNRSAAVENEEPKAILGAVEVAGLVGILRQLGDLAEFSTEVFNGIQEEVTVTVSRCQKLTSRVKRIESALSPLEKAVLSQTSHIHFAYTAGCEWHPRIRNGQRHFVQSDLPLCVMETYEQCRDPPPLHLLDRFDLGGPGSCLRKYSDPTFFRRELSNPNKADDVKVQRDQTHRKRKKKRLQQRNICRSHAVSTSDETNGARLSSLTDDRHSTCQSTSTVDMPRSSNMQDLVDIIDHSHLQGLSDTQGQSEAQIQSGFPESSKGRDSITGSGYIEYVINQGPVNKPDVKLLEGFLSSLQPADRIGSAVPEGCTEVVDDNILYSTSEDIPLPCASIVCNEKKETDELIVENSSKDEKALEINESKFGPGTPDRERQYHRDFDRSYVFFDEVDIVGEKQSKTQANNIDGKSGVEIENKSEQGSEADEFVDARNTIESESESEVDGVPKPKLEHYFGDISTYCSEDANSDNNEGSEDLLYGQMAADPSHDNSVDESCSGSYFPEDANVFCSLSDQVCGKPVSHDQTFHNPMKLFSMFPSSLAEEAFPDEVILQQEPVAAPPFLAGDRTNDKISFEEPISSILSPNDAVPAQKIVPEEEHLAYYLSSAEAVPHEKILPGESDASSFTEIVPHKKILHEKSLPKAPYSTEAVPDDMTPVEEPGAAHPSSPKTVNENKFSPEVLDSKSFSLPEAVSQEQKPREEFVGIYPCLADAAHDERLLPEEPVTACMSSSQVMPIGKLLPEIPSKALHNLSELPQEKAVDLTHPPCAKADVPEVVDIHPCLAEAVFVEKFMTEEPGTTCMSSSKDIRIEKLLPEEPLEAHCYLSELPQEKILPEKTADIAYSPCAKAACPEDNLSPEVIDSTDLSMIEVVPQHQIRLEELVGGDSSLEKDVPDETVLSEEPVTTCQAVAIEKTLPEELLETYPSLSALPDEKILHEETDDATHLYKDVSDEKITPEVSGLEENYLEDFLPQEQSSLEEFVGIDPCLTNAVPDDKLLPEEPVITLPFLVKTAKVEGILPEEPLEACPSFAAFPEETTLHLEADDAAHPSVSGTVSDEQISPEVLDSTSLPVAAAVPQEQILLEEFVCIDPFSAEGIPDKRVLLEEPVPVPIKEVLPDEHSEVYISLEESPQDKILHEKSDDDTHSSCAEAESDGRKFALEEFVGIDPCFSEPVPDERVLQEEPVTTCMSLTEDGPVEEILVEEALELYSSSLEELPEKKISQEEPDEATHPSFSKAVGDEKITPPEALVYTTEADPYNPEEPVASDMSLARAVSDEKTRCSETPGSTTETDPHNTTFLDEPIATTLAKPVPEDKILTKEPAASYLDLAEGIPDQKVFLDDAALLLFAEAIFDQKFSPEVPDSTYPPLREPEKLVATDLPSETILVKESKEAYDNRYTASDVSMNQKNGVLEPASADRTIPPSCGSVTISTDTQEPISIWSNGGLLGLAPSKPPVFAEPSSVSKHIQNDLNENNALATRNQELSSRLVEDTEKSSLSLVVADGTSQQENRMLSHSNGSCSHLQSKATSFKVFGLSHRLLMAGFRGNASSTCKFESIPSTSYDTQVAAIEDKSQQIPLEEQLGYESSLLDSPTSSPPVEHMRISFNSKDASQVSKLKLRIPCQPQHKGENADMFHSFQLVSKSDDDDENSDIFCQSSPCGSDKCLSDSELWDSDESPGKTVSSLNQVGERSTQWEEIGSLSGSVLDLPSFDSLDHQPTSLIRELEREEVVEHNPSVSEIIRDWPPKSSPATTQTQTQTQNQSVG